MSRYCIDARTMTPGEIIASYKQAGNKKTQIKILAELCCTSKDEIIKILKDAGAYDNTPFASKSKYKSLRDEDVPKILKLLNEGKGYKYIADVYGSRPSAVSNKVKNWARKNGCTLHKQVNDKPANLAGSFDENAGDDEDSHKCGKDRHVELIRDITEIYEAMCRICSIYPGIIIDCETDADRIYVSGRIDGICIEYQRGL